MPAFGPFMTPRAAADLRHHYAMMLLENAVECCNWPVATRVPPQLRSMGPAAVPLLPSALLFMCWEPQMGLEMQTAVPLQDYKVMHSVSLDCVPVQREVHGARRLAVPLLIGCGALLLLPLGGLLRVALLREHAELALDDLQNLRFCSYVTRLFAS